MEEHKISYLPLWEKYLELFEEVGLENEQIGKLVTMMMQYHFRQQEPEQLEPELKSTWFFLRRDLDFARKQYMISVENGKKGGRKKKTAVSKESEQEPDETCTNPEEPGETQGNPEEPKETRKNLAKGNTRTESKTRTKTISLSQSITGTDTEASTRPWTAAGPAAVDGPPDPDREFVLMREAAKQRVAAYC